MQITPVPAKSLTPAHWQAWSEIQDTHPELASPHFSAEFMQCLAAHRDRLEVAVLTNNGQTLGFLPYHRSARNSGEPIAGSFSELQGFIAPPDITVDIRDVLRACGLSRLNFTDVLSCQTALQEYHAVEGVCPYLDVSGGFEQYRSARRSAGSDEVQQTLRKARKVEREIAPVRVELFSTDEAILDTLLGWKQRQLQQRKLADPFLAEWPRRLMTQMLNINTEKFGGMLTLLYIGDHLSAASMGFRSQSVLNVWVNAYDLKYQKFSPGLILLMEIAQAAPSLGIKRIDLGRGDEGYKKSLGSGGIPVAEGIVERNRFALALRNAGFQAREWVRTTPVGQPARRVVQRCRYALSQWKAGRAH